MRRLILATALSIDDDVTYGCELIFKTLFYSDVIFFKIKLDLFTFTLLQKIRMNRSGFTENSGIYREESMEWRIILAEYQLSQF